MSGNGHEPGTLIRATHWASFRSGEWARLKGTAMLPGFPEGDRACYLVEFPDGVTDFWAVSDGACAYEFRDTPPGPVTGG